MVNVYTYTYVYPKIYFKIYMSQKLSPNVRAGQRFCRNFKELMLKRRTMVYLIKKTKIEIMEAKIIWDHSGIIAYACILYIDAVVKTSDSVYFLHLHCVHVYFNKIE